MLRGFRRRAARRSKLSRICSPSSREGEQYRLIFMHRDMREVVASQKAMLERLGRKGGELAEARLMRAYTQQLVRVQTWLRRRAEIPVLAAELRGGAGGPGGHGGRLARFLGEPFDAHGAAAAIEPSFRRQHHGLTDH